MEIDETKTSYLISDDGSNPDPEKTEIERVGELAGAIAELKVKMGMIAETEKLDCQKRLLKLSAEELRESYENLKELAPLLSKENLRAAIYGPEPEELGTTYLIPDEVE